MVNPSYTSLAGREVDELARATERLVKESVRANDELRRTMKSSGIDAGRRDLRGEAGILKHIEGKAQPIKRYQARPIGERRPKLNYTFGFTKMVNIGRENHRLSTRMCNILEGQASRAR
jgi:hypothetical protein